MLELGPAAARLRRPPARRRHRRALRAAPARSSRCSTARCSTLEPDLLLVCDEKKPLGLAGIMGGEHSGISDTTTTVFLEGAFWNPAVIQGKSRRLGFVSDAGYRFERGVDFDGCARARRARDQLILDICGGRAGPLDDRRGRAAPRAAGARAPRARRAPARRRRCPADAIAALLRPAAASRTRATATTSGHAAVLSLRPRHRGGLRRGNRAPPRLRRDSRGAGGARAGDAARRPSGARAGERAQAHAWSRATGRRRSPSAS